METAYVEQKKPEMLEQGMEFFHQYTDAGMTATRAHVHDSVELLYVTDGSFYITQDGLESEIFPGDVAFIRSSCIHTVQAKEEKEKNGYFVLKLDPSLIFSLSPEKSAARYALHLTIQSEGAKTVWRREELSKSEIPAAFERLERIRSEHLAAEDLLSLSSAFQIIAELVSDLESKADCAKSLPSPTLEQIYKSTVYVNRHYTEDLTALGMSKMLNMSYSYFSRTFIKVTGKSFRSYLNTVRIRRAEQLLLTTQDAVTEIATKCGYNNVSHFIATYKCLKGTTPYKTKKEK